MDEPLDEHGRPLDIPVVDDLAYVLAWFLSASDDTDEYMYEEGRRALRRFQNTTESPLRCPNCGLGMMTVVRICDRCQHTELV